MARYKRYRWRDNKGNRRPDQQDGPVKIIGSVPTIPLMPPRDRHRILAVRKAIPDRRNFTAP